MTTIRQLRPQRSPGSNARWLLCAAGCALNAVAADQPKVLDEVVTSASRSEQRVMDTAASINVVNSQQIHEGQAEQNLSEPLARAPGIFALNRQNYAQDLLISSRGFGANSTFGARSIKIFVDGIPGTMADGQGQMSHIDLASTDRIEVMRGPFSALYGNSAGGVISVFTENGRPGAAATPYFSAGSYGQRKYGVKFDGELNNINYVLDAGLLHTNGYRDHSNTDRQNDNLKLGFKLGADTALTVVANNLSLRALDPLGLTATQLNANQQGTGTNSIPFNTRKSVDQTQGGLMLTHHFGSDDTVTLAPYYGNRHTIQFLAAAANGVIDLQRAFYGMNGNWLHNTTFNGMPLKIVSGLEGNMNQDHRMGYANNGGSVTGPATQNYSMSARNRDVFVQTELRATDRLALNAGLRQSQTSLSSISNLTPGQSPGTHTYQAFTGMASIQYYLRDTTNVYLSFGSGFDTPTLNQVFYSSANVANPAVANTGNIGLQAARTRQAEIGVKSEISSTTQANLALFKSNTTNDIVIDVANAGRTAFGNAPKTQRQGLELSAQTQLPFQLQASVAYTWLSAKVVQTYTEFNGTVVTSGNRIPGVPDQGLFAELMWRKADKALELAVEARAAGSISANDVNAAHSSGYGIANVRAVARQTIERWTITEFARVDNVFDRAYVGSLIVNQAAGQFYESAPGRNWLTGVRASYSF